MTKLLRISKVTCTDGVGIYKNSTGELKESEITSMKEKLHMLINGERNLRNCQEGLNASDLWDICKGDLATVMHEQLKIQTEMFFPAEEIFRHENGFDDCKCVLDLGTGNGAYMEKLSKAHPETTFLGLDKNSEMIIRAKQHDLPNVDFKVGNLIEFDLAFPIEQVDAVFMRYVCMYLADMPELLLKLFDKLNDGTKLYFFEPDLELMKCEPYDPAFDIYKRGFNGFHDRHTFDRRIGYHLPHMLSEAGFSSIIHKPDPTSTRTVPINMFQRFVMQTLRAFIEYAPGVLNEQDVKNWIDFVSNRLPNHFVRHGISMVFAKKGDK